MYKTKQPTQKYWREKATQRLVKHPSLTGIFKTGMKKYEQTYKITHQEGSIVEINGELAIVDEVTKRGTWIKPMKSTEEDIFELKKRKFIKEPEYSENAKSFERWIIPV